MDWEILSIGDEIISGSITDLHAGFISKYLYARGDRIISHMAISDNPKEIQSAIQQAILKNHSLIATGGLGPTIDDLTKKAISEFLKSPLVMEKKILKDLKKRFKNLSSLEEQASIPKGANYFMNQVGTAPGLFFKEKSSLFFVLPGPKEEMREMFIKQVLPFLNKNYPTKKKDFTKDLFFLLIEEVKIDSFLKTISKKHKDVKIGIYPSFANVKLQLSSFNKASLLSMIKKIKREFSFYVYSEEESDIAKVLHDALVKENIKIAFAESCTGGALASSVTAIAGSSKYFLGSIVAYANEMKQTFLNVSEKTLHQKGALSGSCIQEMLNGLFKNTNADFGVAISGIAGPSKGETKKPVGTVFIGIGDKKGAFDIGSIKAPGNRTTVISYTVSVALFMLYQRIFFNRRFFS